MYFLIDLGSMRKSSEVSFVLVLTMCCRCRTFREIEGARALRKGAALGRSTVGVSCEQLYMDAAAAWR